LRREAVNCRCRCSLSAEWVARSSERGAAFTSFWMVPRSLPALRCRYRLSAAVRPSPCGRPLSTHTGRLTIKSSWPKPVTGRVHVRCSRRCIASDCGALATRADSQKQTDGSGILLADLGCVKRSLPQDLSHQLRACENLGVLKPSSVKRSSELALNAISGNARFPTLKCRIFGYVERTSTTGRFDPRARTKHRIRPNSTPN
jgi:hypothetical protein